MTKNYTLNRNRYGEVTNGLAKLAKLKTTAMFLLLMLFFMGSGSMYAQDWKELAKALPTPYLNANDDEFGYSVSVDGDYAVVGSSSNNNNTGYAYVLYNNAGTWESLAKLTASDGAFYDYFGYSVFISGDHIVIGAYGDDDNGNGSGSAYVFSKPAAGWIDMTQTAKLTASDGASSDNFGCSVSISGDNIVVGAYGDDDNGSRSGSAYVFSKPGAGWTNMFQNAKLTALDGISEAYFGYSVSISADHIVIGAYGDDDNGSYSGSAYVFLKPVAGWADMTQTAKLTASDGASADYFGNSVSISGDNIVIGAYGDDDNGSTSGSAYVFSKPAAGWADMIQTAKLTALDGAADDYFSLSVSISGDNIVVGACFDDDNGSSSGSAYVFSKPGAGWTDMTQTAKLTASDGAVKDDFGCSVSISGDNIVVGAIGDDDNGPNAGSTYMFLKPGSGWSDGNEIKKILPQGTLNNDSENFGHSVSVDGNYAVVGADLYKGSTGYAYIFYNNAGTWEKLAQLTASDGAEQDRFGFSVSISGDNIVIGAYLDDSKGSAYVFSKPVAGWADMTQTAKLTASDGAFYDYFGRSVSISGDNIVIGADNSSNKGSAYVFSKPVAGWADMTQTAKLTASDPAFSDNFGYSVSISGDNIVIGAYGDDDNAFNSGSAYLFSKPAAGWADMTQNAKLLASDAAGSDNFGLSVSISGDNIVIGAEGSNSSKGSAYVFSKPVAGWTDMTQTAKLTASDAAFSDVFGNLVSISGDNIVVGAKGDDDNGNRSGSAYVFSKPATGWIDMTQTAKLTASDGAADDFFGGSVSISGDNIVVGAYGDDDNGNTSGSAYFFGPPPAPTVTAQPLDQIDIAMGDDASFTIAGTDVGTYQWQVDEGSGFVNITDGGVYSNATTATLNITGVTLAMNNFQYRCYIENISGNATSDAATLTVIPLAPTANDGTFIYDGNEKSASATPPAGTSVIWYTAATGTTLSAAPSATTAGVYTAYAASKDDVSGSESATRTLVTLTITAKPITVTADADQTKVYGETDPEFTYTASEALVGTDAFSGSLTRVAGEDVNTYAIEQGTLALSANYDMSFVGADFEITAKPITVTADADQTKVYGETDPEFTYTASEALIGTDAFSGSLTRVAGEDVNTYAIAQGTLALGTNYDLSFVGADFEITAKPITVTADADQTKVYGETDPEFTYTASEALIGTDAFSGSLTRTTGEDVNTYAIEQGTLALSANYDMSFVGADFEITAKPITVTADAGQTKLYGETDPEFTYTPSEALIGTDAFSGSLTRTTGEDVNTYAIEQGTLALGTNYDMSFVGADFEITAKPITVTADAGQTKVYGETDPEFTYTASEALVGTDAFIGSLTRVAGEDVGTYAIEQGTLTLGANYDLSFVGADFEITAKPITVTADADQTKVYGETDPEFTYTASEALIGTDVFSGSLTRVAGEDVNTYAIDQGTLTLGANYDMSFVGADFEITAKPITVTADADQTKVYGETDPEFTYTPSEVLVGTDAFSGSLTRVAGEDVGTYAIEQGTLTLGINYDMSFVDADFEITVKPISVTADADQGKVYGETDPGFTYTASEALIGDDAFSGSLTRVAGEDVNTYAIEQGTLALSANYDMSFVGADFEITKATLTATAEDTTKIEGEVNPEFTVVFTGFAFSDDETSISELPLASCAADENSPAGDYSIVVSGGSASNYNFSYVSGTLAIEEGSSISTMDKLVGNIYPNPTTGNITIQLTQLSNNTQLRITDISGKTILMKELSQLQTTIDLSNNTLGVFVVTITNNDGIYQTKVILK